MKIKHIIILAIIISVNGVVFADRDLSRGEILQICQQLTSQPRKTWIPAGTIQATHLEYKAPKTTDTTQINTKINEKIQAYLNKPNKPEVTEDMQILKLGAMPFNVRYELSNEYTMSSAVTIKYDGDRFYWEISVKSRTDSVKPGNDLKGNVMTEQFNLDWNGRRIFAWDGENYVTYCPGAESATVDSASSVPRSVKGPLTAGIIPWGHGFYSYDNLAACDSSAVETSIDGQTQIQLTLNSNDLEMVFVLDPAKDYATISFTMNKSSYYVLSRYYSNYELVSGNWVPKNILTEKHEAGSNKLLSRDLWTISSISGEVPPIESFQIEFEDDTTIQYSSLVTDRPITYCYSGAADTDKLLAEKLAFAANESSRPQNCATASLKYVTSKLGKEPADSQLAKLVAGRNSATSLYAMKQFAQGLGLYCRAVKTDIRRLQNLDGCKVILHLPERNHFVVLDDIDDGYAKVIDLTVSRFYYRTDINSLKTKGDESAALLVSNRPIEGRFAEIDEAGLAGIVGAAYQCNVLFQEYEYQNNCIIIGGECDGDHRIYWTRWRCGTAASGICSMPIMERMRKAMCLDSLEYPGEECDTDEWVFYYMRACL